MKALNLILFALIILFSSCKKKEESPATDNRDKYTGTWTGTELCNSVSETYDFTIEEGESNEVIIKNFGNFNINVPVLVDLTTSNEIILNGGNPYFINVDGQNLRVDITLLGDDDNTDRLENTLIAPTVLNIDYSMNNSNYYVADKVDYFTMSCKIDAVKK